MTGRTAFDDLTKDWPVERRDGVKDKTKSMLEEYDLAALRLALDLTQNDVADGLETGQGNVARLERQTDMKVSTLRRYIEQLGGKLSLHVELPNGGVVLKGVGDRQP